MKHFGKLLTKNDGLTLVEVLATLVISTMILGIAYGVLTSGYKTYQKINIEGALRDEADYVVSRIMQIFYATDISDIIDCSHEGEDPDSPNDPNTCIEIHSTETSKISADPNDKKVSIVSIDDLKADSAETITRIIIDQNNILIRTYDGERVDNKIKIKDPTTPRNEEQINADQFEFNLDSATPLGLAANCSYSSSIAVDPRDPVVIESEGLDKKFIKRKCNNGIVQIAFNIKKENVADDNLQLELKSTFGF